jgi:hypothetical protein
MTNENLLLKQVQTRFEEAVARELVGSRDLEWFLTKDADNNYPSAPIQAKWLVFKSKYPELVNW